MEEIRDIFEVGGQLGLPVGFIYTKTTPFGPCRERRQLIPDPIEPVRRNQRGELYAIGQDLARGDVRSFALARMTEVDPA